MEFARPGWLWLGVLAVPLVLLHLRRRRKFRVVVPSLLVFDATLLGEAPPRMAGLLPREVLGLLLLLGALAGLSLGAAGPVEGGTSARPRPLVLVLDASASTGAAGRFEEEVVLARRCLDSVGEGTPVTILLAGPEPRAVPTLDGARPAAGPGSSLRAAAEAATKSGGEVVVFTDGCDAEPLPDGVRVVSVGRPERNRGIVGFALDLRRDGNPALFLRVREEDGTIREEDRSAEARPPWRIALPAGDAFAADDAVEIRAEPPRPIRVAVLGKSDPFLEAALEACGSAVDAAGSVRIDPAALGNLTIPPDVLVGEGVESSIPALVFGAGEGPDLEAPAVQAGDRSHPVMRGVDPAEWIVTRARTLVASAGDAVLLQGPKGPLAIARKGRILLGFRPGESTLPLSGSWPVFLRNSLAWLAGEPPPPTATGLLDARESDLAPRIPRNADAFVLPSRPAPGRGPRSLGVPFAAAAAALLAAEALLRAFRRESFGAPAPAS